MVARRVRLPPTLQCNNADNLNNLTMKLFKIESPSYDEGYFKCMERNGKIKSNIHYIDVGKIISVKKYAGDLLHKGWICSKIEMQNGTTFIDKREVEIILNDISNFKH